MTVKVYIWKGTNPDLSVYNVRGDVGHASIQILDETKSNDIIYISHRPKEEEKSSDIPDTSTSPSKRNNKDLFKYARKPPAEREKYKQDKQDKQDFTFETERDEIRKREPDVVIEIKGLDESRMREFWKEYSNDKLDISYYHIKKSNCSKIVASFLRVGLRCPQDSYCSLCVPVENVGQRRTWVYFIIFGIGFWLIRYKLWFDRNSANTNFFINLIFSLVLIFPVVMWFFIPIDAEYVLLMKLSQKDFWSPQTLERFANKVKEHTSKISQKMCKKKKIPANLLK